MKLHLNDLICTFELMNYSRQIDPMIVIFVTIFVAKILLSKFIYQYVIISISSQLKKYQLYTIKLSYITKVDKNFSGW